MDGSIQRSSQVSTLFIEFGCFILFYSTWGKMTKERWEKLQKYRKKIDKKTKEKVTKKIDKTSGKLTKNLLGYMSVNQKCSVPSM